jgi:uncharacterized membrane protein
MQACDAGGMREVVIGLGVLLSALGSGLVAGFFYAFSTTVMKSLGKLPAPQGIAAMQTINVVVMNPWFLSVFLGTALACFGSAVAAIARWQRPGAGYALAGAVLYLAGTLAVTMLFNVPRNDALAAVDAHSAEGAALWAEYLSSWTLWNHVRSAAALAAAALFSVTLLQRS